MSTRSRSTWRVLPAICSLLLACEAPPQAIEVPLDPAIDSGATAPPELADCSRPNAGCACDPGTAPIACHPDPRIGETRRCVPGLRSCRSGVWSGCEVGPEGDADGVAVEALVSGPSQCNPCDPQCFSTTTRPTSPTDIDTNNSSNVTVDPIVGGIQLTQQGTYTGTGDTDGDGIPDDFDAFPMDPTRNGFTENGGIFHMLPAGVNAGPDPVSISTTIRTADIYVLMDATGSMAGEIDNLKTSLLSGSYLSGTVYPTVVPGTPPEARASAFDLGSDPLPGVHPIQGDTTSMANDVTTGSGCSGNGRDAVYTFTLTQAQTVVIETSALWDTSISLRNAAFTQVGCHNNISATNLNSRLTMTNLAAGQYYLVVEGASALAAGPFTVSFTFNGANCSGVLGAVRCLIPDAWFGVGWFREIPVSPHGNSLNNVYVHTLDETGDVTSIANAVNALGTQGNVDWPESLTQGLFSAVTGNGLGPYWPARSANPAFAPCPAGSWGYACFRNGTIPIVIAFTDAPSHEAPDALYDYTVDTRWPASADITVTGNDTEATAYDMGDITAWVGTADRRIYAGRTDTQADNYDVLTVGCNGTARDAVYKFTLTATRRVQLSTYDSRLGNDTVLSLFRNSVSPLTRLACNDDIYFSSVQSQITTTLPAGTYYVTVDGAGGASGRHYLHVNGRPNTTGAPPYPSAEFPAYWEYTSNALADHRVKFIGIRSCNPGAGGDEGNFCPGTYNNLRDIAQTTGSIDTDGSPFVYTIQNNGTGLSTAVVTAVQRLASISRMNIQARAVDNPATAFDERNFIYAINITNCPAARCAGPRSGTLCGQCLPGTDVGFEVIFRNTGVAPTGVPRQSFPQTFDFTFELVGDNTYILNSVPVRIVVPPVYATYAPMGTYALDFDSGVRCASATEGPVWGRFDWTSTIAPGTRIDFQIRNAATQADLAIATPYTLTTPPSVSPVTSVQALLSSIGVPDYLRWARVTAVLYSDATMSQTPRLDQFSLSYTCVPNQ
jgi:Bacterial pre-peptidase C-terminal domain